MHYVIRRVSRHFAVVVFSSDVSKHGVQTFSSEDFHTVNPLVYGAILSQSDVFAELCD